MSLAKAQSAIVTRYQGAEFGLTTFYPGVNYEPTARENHVRFWFVPNANDGASLGRGGIDRLSGIAQFDLMYGDGDGVGEALEMADNIARRFLRGYSQDYDGTDVVFTGATVLQPRNENGWLRVPVSVGWYVNVARTNYVVVIGCAYPLDCTAGESPYGLMTITGDDENVGSFTLVGNPAQNPLIAIGAPTGVFSGTATTLDFSSGIRVVEHQSIAFPAAFDQSSPYETYRLSAGEYTTDLSSVVLWTLKARADGTIYFYVSRGAGLSTVHTSLLASIPSVISTVYDAGNSTFSVLLDGVAVSLSNNAYTPGEFVSLLFVNEFPASSDANDTGKVLSVKKVTKAADMLGTYTNGETDPCGNAI